MKPNDVKKKTEDLGSRVTITGHRRRGSSRSDSAKGDKNVTDLVKNYNWSWQEVSVLVKQGLAGLGSG